MLLTQRLITAVLILTLTGGAQACMAWCAQPVASNGPVNAPAAPKACRHCQKPRPAEGVPDSQPAVPCKHCQAVAADRTVAPERETAAPVQPLAFAALLPVELALSADATIVGPRSRVDLPAPAPPNELLHVLCSLLI